MSDSEMQLGDARVGPPPLPENYGKPLAPAFLGLFLIGMLAGSQWIISQVAEPHLQETAADDSGMPMQSR